MDDDEFVMPTLEILEIEEALAVMEPMPLTWEKAREIDALILDG